MNFRILGLALVATSALLAGCATSRSEVRMPAPAAATAVQGVPSGRTVIIGAITDARVFEQAPAEPSTPSLGSGGAAQAGEALKSKAIARKRNTYGQALGDVLLQEGQTVSGLVREHLTSAFEQAGYRVVSTAPASGPMPVTIDVTIKKFWAWMRPGFWALEFNSQIETVLTPSAGAAPSSTTIAVAAQSSGQVGTDDAWINIVQKALADYRAKVASAMSGPSF